VAQTDSTRAKDANEVDTLRREVATLRSRVQQLEVQLARQSEPGAPNGRNGSFTGSPYRSDVSVADEQMPVGSWAWEIPSGRIQWSEELFSILGYDPQRDSPSTEAFLAAIHPDDADRVRNNIARKVADQIHYRIIWPTGEVRYVTMAGAMLFDNDGALSSMVGVVSDLTAHRQTIAGLRKMNGRLQAAQALAALGSWELTLASKNVWVSPQLLQLLSLSKHNCTLQALRQRIDESQRSDFDLMHDPAQNRDGLQQTFRLAEARSKERFVSVRTQPIADASGRVVAISGTMFDVTDRVELQKRWARAQTWDAVGSFATDVSHDFSNLLTVVLGNLELHSANLNPLPPELDDAFHALRWAQALTNRLLALGRRDRAEHTPVDPNVIVGSVVQLLARVVGEGVSISTQLEPNTPSISIDRERFEQALVNLVLNARDVMNGGGQIEIGTRAIERGGRQYTELFVADNGPGVEPALRERVFEPFFTTKKRGKGAGLGLTMVLSTVEQHGGEVVVDTSEQGGALFRVFLPHSGVNGHSAPMPLSGQGPESRKPSRRP